MSPLSKRGHVRALHIHPICLCAFLSLRKNCRRKKVDFAKRTQFPWESAVQAFPFKAIQSLSKVLEEKIIFIDSLHLSNHVMCFIHMKTKNLSVQPAKFLLIYKISSPDSVISYENHLQLTRLGRRHASQGFAG